MNPEWVTSFSYLVMVITVLFSLGVILARSPIFAAMNLIGSLLTTAILYVMLSAHFIAVTQVLIYAGGILVLFIYILMLLGLKNSNLRRWQQFALLTGFLTFITLIILPSVGAFRQAKILTLTRPTEDFGSIEMFANILLKNYTYCFEVISVILVAALVAVVYLSQQRAQLRKSI